MGNMNFNKPERKLTRFGTPLRYPGGKAKLTKWFKDLIIYNDIENCHYIETYAGGAGAAINLLLSGVVSKITINDIDPMIHSFWWSLLNHTDELIEMIIKTEVTPENWYIQKEIMLQHECYSLIEKGFATFFLNRTNRSGILTGGMIGGKKQDGNYKIDARYNKSELINRIKLIANYASDITLFQHDALEMFEWIDNCNPKETLLYLDPPYYNKGSQLYRNHYTYDDHVAISDKVRNTKVPCIVTYDNCIEIERIYEGVSRDKFHIGYSTHMHRPTATELLFHRNIKLHDIPMA